MHGFKFQSNFHAANSSQIPFTFYSNPIQIHFKFQIPRKFHSNFAQIIFNSVQFHFILDNVNSRLKIPSRWKPNFWPRPNPPWPRHTLQNNTIKADLLERVSFWELKLLKARKGKLGAAVDWERNGSVCSKVKDIHGNNDIELKKRSQNKAIIRPPGLIGRGPKQ